MKCHLPPGSGTFVDSTPALRRLTTVKTPSLLGLSQSRCPKHEFSGNRATNFVSWGAFFLKNGLKGPDLALQMAPGVTFASSSVVSHNYS